jgi:GTPase involved in cell partitioning and DNA repair
MYSGQSTVDVAQLRPVAELINVDDVYIAARGGRGGRGNKFFATAQDTCPRMAELGGAPERRCYALEMKLLANTALVSVCARMHTNLRAGGLPQRRQVDTIARNLACAP